MLRRPEYPKNINMQGFMYIPECDDGSYYTGSTKDLEIRLAQHQSGKGANHTKKHPPVKLVYYERFPRIDMAFEREKQVQGWSRKKKEALINGEHDRLPELAKAYRDIDASSASASESASGNTPSRASGNTPSGATGSTPSTSSVTGEVSETLDVSEAFDVSEALEDTIKKQHLDFIKEHPLKFSVSLHGFSEEEVHFVEKYGNWLEALRKGELKPITNRQKEVVKELNSQIPWTKCVTEAAQWKKYLRRKIEDEKGTILNAPLPTIEDDPFGSREEFKAMRKGQFSTISKQHRS